MTSNPYEFASRSARDAVIQALYDNIETNKLSELWRHYLGLRSLSESIPYEIENPTFENHVKLNFISGDPSPDTISFGEELTLDNDSYAENSIGLTAF